MTISISESKFDRPAPGEKCRSISSHYKCFQNYYHALKYLQPRPSYISNVKSSVNHWQLRDLVQVDPSTGNIYYTLDDSIRALHVFPFHQETIHSHDHCRLPYFPRCFSHSPGGHVVAGGVVTSLSRVFSMDVPNLTRGFNPSPHRSSKGLFSFSSPFLPEQLTFSLGEMINNAVTIYPKHGSDSSFTSYVCNNDSNLYTLDISNERVAPDRKFLCEANTSLNNVHQLPDGRLLTATGDSNSFFLLDLKMANPEIETIKTSHGSGFGISYHNNESTLAVAFEDGICQLYDLRKASSNPISEIKSTRPGHQSGAFRCCKFLHTAVQDLLVVLEHVGRVHLIDLKDLDEANHQVLVFPFALDQFGRYRHERLSVREKLLRSQNCDNLPDDCEMDDSNGDYHKRFEIYDENNAHFNAPLVYDYSYLADENPKLFKDYVYQRPKLPVCEGRSNSLEVPRMGSPTWRSEPSSFASDHDPYSSFQETSDLEQRSRDIIPEDVTERLDLEVGNADVTRHNCPDGTQRSYPCHDSFQQSVNHIHGEMELSGIDWLDNQLYIGCEDGGIVTWDVNVRARRSFGSFSYV